MTSDFCDLPGSSIKARDQGWKAMATGSYGDDSLVLAWPKTVCSLS